MVLTGRTQPEGGLGSHSLYWDPGLHKQKLADSQVEGIHFSLLLEMWRDKLPQVSLL